MHTLLNELVNLISYTGGIVELFKFGLGHGEALGEEGDFVVVELVIDGVGVGAGGEDEVDDGEDEGAEDEVSGGGAEDIFAFVGLLAGGDDADFFGEGAQSELGLGACGARFRHNRADLFEESEGGRVGVVGGRGGGGGGEGGVWCVRGGRRGGRKRVGSREKVHRIMIMVHGVRHVVLVEVVVGGGGSAAREGLWGEVDRGDRLTDAG